MSACRIRTTRLTKTEKPHELEREQKAACIVKHPIIMEDKNLIKGNKPSSKLASASYTEVIATT